MVVPKVLDGGSPFKNASAGLFNSSYSWGGKFIFLYVFWGNDKIILVRRQIVHSKETQRLRGGRTDTLSIWKSHSLLKSQKQEYT